MSSLFNSSNGISIPAANAGFVAGGPRQLAEPFTDVGSLALYASFAYGSGGTSVDAYVQTSFDGGLNYMDVAHFSFLLANKTRAFNLSGNTAVTAIVTPSVHTLAADTALDGFLGSLYRVWLVIVGTYAGTTLNISTNRRMRPFGS